MNKTLAEHLHSSSVDFETLHRHYHPVLVMVKQMIGVIPNCDPVLEIWPPAFRAYNILVPNFFNLPQSIFGNKSFKVSMGLAMYAASRAAGCPYCSAHTCSFALRRGATTESINGIRTPKEAAVVALAEGLSRVPTDLTLSGIKTVREYFSREQTEWLVLAISMMGFLNKFMDVMGIELEQDSINDTAAILTKTGWSPGKHVRGEYSVTHTVTPARDNLFTYLRILRQAPGAVALEKKWTSGVPGRYSDAATYLKQRTGYTFPLLQPLSQTRALRAITAVLRDHLDEQQTVIGLKAKMLTGYLFSCVVANSALTIEVKNLATHMNAGLDDQTYTRLDEMARVELPADINSCLELCTGLQQQTGMTNHEAAAALLARAASTSPAAVHDAVIETVTRQLEPEGIVETVAWLSVLQLLHRLSTYFAIVNKS